jgi:hypothetical protein
MEDQTMVATVVPIALFVALGFIIIGVTRIVSEGRTRRRLIEAGATPELASAITAAPQGDAGLRAALQWGLVIGAVGIALIIIQFLPYGPDEPISLGIVLVFAAAGLLAYYVAGRRLAREEGARGVS